MKNDTMIQVEGDIESLRHYYRSGEIICIVDGVSQVIDRTSPLYEKVLRVCMERIERLNRRRILYGY